MEQNITPPEFTYSKWRHGGWYVHGIRYPSGATGCVSNNYEDKKWRIACDPRPFAEQPTFKTRGDAALAEWHLVQTMVSTEPNYEAIATSAGYELKENVATATNNGLYCVKIGDRDDAPFVHPTPAQAWKACCLENDLLAEIGDAEPAAAAVLQEAVNAWPQFSPGHARYDEEVNGGDAVEWLGGFLERARAALAGAPPLSVAPAPATRTIWTCTTDGDNCPLTTTVHATQADAMERVCDDLDDKIGGLDTITAEELSEAWGNANDGACIFESHEITLPPVPILPAAPAVDWRLIAQDLAGALDSTTHQIGQMRCMFDDGDGTIAEAVSDAELASERYTAAVKMDSSAPGTLPSVAIIISGGMLSAILSDDPAMIGREITVIDYDTDGAEEVVMIQQSEGRDQPAFVRSTIIEGAGDFDIEAAKAAEPGPASV